MKDQALDGLDELNGRFARGHEIRFRLGPLGLTVAQLERRGHRALVALRGAQVLSYAPANGRDLLWLSDAARLGEGKAPRGGIPVCWPWFGQHPTDASRPAHGFARHRLWTLQETFATPEATGLRLSLDTGPGASPDWPHAARVELKVWLADGLWLDLTTTNLDIRPLPLTQALHTYFAISDVDHTRVDGLDGAPYTDHVGARTRRQQVGPILLDREVNRVFDHSPGQVRIDDTGYARRITIDKLGSRSTVVWNPWTAGSDRLGDMGEDGYRRMVCVETANAGEDALLLAPGGSHTLSARLGEGPLSDAD